MRRFLTTASTLFDSVLMKTDVLGLLEKKEEPVSYFVARLKQSNRLYGTFSLQLKYSF